MKTQDEQTFETAVQLVQKIKEALENNVLFFKENGEQLFEIEDILNALGNDEHVEIISAPIIQKNISKLN